MHASPVVYFLHLVNTGGLSLYPTLQRHYAPETCWPGARWWRRAPDRYVSRRMYRIRPNFPAQVGQTFDEQLASIDGAAVRVVLGHFRYGVHRRIARPSVYFTMLREPVSRVVSYYHWLRRTVPAVLMRGGRLLGIDAWLEDPSFSGVVRNDQVRSLAGIGGPAWTPDGAPADDPVWVELALRNLDAQFRVVGLMERYDESVERLRQAFGWWVVVPSRRRSRMSHGARPEASAATLQRIAELNALDLVLYAAVAERFERVR